LPTRQEPSRNALCQASTIFQEPYTAEPTRATTAVPSPNPSPTTATSS